MQTVLQSAVRTQPEQGQVRSTGTAILMPYRRHQSICTDEAFVGLLNAYRTSGGLAPAEELLASIRHRGGPDINTLARWIVARQVIHFAWQARTWLPLFQFCPLENTPRRELGPVLAELNAVYDEFEVATWFATPNLSLAQRSPVQAFAMGCSAVLRAASIDRFVADA
jgi:hypothetical protein